MVPPCTPQTSPFNRVFHYRPSIFGVPLFLETPIFIHTILRISNHACKNRCKKTAVGKKNEKHFGMMNRDSKMYPDVAHFPCNIVNEVLLVSYNDPCLTYPLSSKILRIPCEYVFGPPKGLVRRCLWVQTSTHKVFGRLGYCLFLIGDMIQFGNYCSTGLLEPPRIKGVLHQDMSLVTRQLDMASQTFKKIVDLRVLSTHLMGIPTKF